MKIVVIGAGKGLGRVLTEKFIAEGHQVVAGVVEKTPGAELSALAEKSAGSLLLLHADVTDDAVMKAAADKVAQVFDQIDAVINVAGVLLKEDQVCDIFTLDLDELRLSLEVNAVGVVIVAKHFYPLMRKDSKGMLISVTSEAGSMSNSGAGYPGYSISKAAANKAVGILRETVSDVDFYALHPGRMNTEMGRANAQIEPEVSSDAIYEIVTGKKQIPSEAGWFINYKGEAMVL